MTITNPGGRIPFPYQQAPTTIFVTGLLAGVLDGLAAVISFVLQGGNDPLKIFTYIGSAAFGPGSFDDPFPITIAGFIFHFFIAWCFTIFYFVIYPKISFLRKNWVVSGLIYGLLVWVVMNLGVLPLSKLPPLKYPLVPVLRGMVILMVMIGLPISYMVKRYYSFGHI